MSTTTDKSKIGTYKPVSWGKYDRITDEKLTTMLENDNINYYRAIANGCGIRVIASASTTFSTNSTSYTDVVQTDNFTLGRNRVLRVTFFAPYVTYTTNAFPSWQIVDSTGTAGKNRWWSWGDDLDNTNKDSESINLIEYFIDLAPTSSAYFKVQAKDQNAGSTFSLDMTTDANDNSDTTLSPALKYYLIVEDIGSARAYK